MTVGRILYGALLGKKRRETGSARDLSLAAALTAGLYEISEALGHPGGDVQRSLDLIVSASASILRMERCVLLLKAPGGEELQLRALAGIPRPRQFEKYRQEIHESIFAQVIASGEGAVLAEGRPAVDRKILRLMRRLDVKGFVIAPVKVPEGVIGVLVGATPLDGRDLSDADLKLLAVMANFAGVAVENARLVGRLEKKARKLAAIFDISKALNEEGDVAVLSRLIVDRATELMGSTSGSMILVDPPTGELRIEAERGLGPGVKERLRLRIGEGITGWVAREGVPALVPDVRKDPRYVEANPAVRSEMAVPVKWGTEVLGVINLDHEEPGAFTAEDVDLLQAFGHAAAVALRHARRPGGSQGG